MLQELPSKEEVVERVAMAYEQQELYDELKQTFVKRIAEKESKGAHIGMLMMLRKVFWVFFFFSHIH